MKPLRRELVTESITNKRSVARLVHRPSSKTSISTVRMRWFDFVRDYSPFLFFQLITAGFTRAAYGGGGAWNPPNQARPFR